MAYIEIKRIKGREYAYLRENIKKEAGQNISDSFYMSKTPDKTVHTSKYLGAVNPKRRNDLLGLSQDLRVKMQARQKQPRVYY